MMTEFMPNTKAHAMSGTSACKNEKPSNEAAVTPKVMYVDAATPILSVTHPMTSVATL